MFFDGFISHGTKIIRSWKLQATFGNFHELNVEVDKAATEIY